MKKLKDLTREARKELTDMQAAMYVVNDIVKNKNKLEFICSPQIQPNLIATFSKTLPLDEQAALDGFMEENVLLLKFRSDVCDSIKKELNKNFLTIYYTAKNEARKIVGVKKFGIKKDEDKTSRLPRLDIAQQIDNQMTILLSKPEDGQSMDLQIAIVNIEDVLTRYTLATRRFIDYYEYIEKFSEKYAIFSALEEKITPSSAASQSNSNTESSSSNSSKPKAYGLSRSPKMGDGFSLPPLAGSRVSTFPTLPAAQTEAQPIAKVQSNTNSAG